MPQTLSSHLRTCNFYTTAVAYNTFIANPLPGAFNNFLIENADGELEEDAEPDEDMLEEAHKTNRPVPVLMYDN